MGFSHGKIRLLFRGESQQRQSCATQPIAQSGCFSSFITHRTLTWTTGSLTCTQVVMHVIAKGGGGGRGWVGGDVRTHVRVSALKVNSGRKIPCRTEESNLRQPRDGPMLYQSATSPPLPCFTNCAKEQFNFDGYIIFLLC